jgi:hypothetical protein
MKKLEWLISIMTALSGIATLHSVGKLIPVFNQVTWGMSYLPLFLISLFLTPYLGGVIANQAWSYPVKSYLEYLRNWTLTVIVGVIVAVGSVSLILGAFGG